MSSLKKLCFVSFVSLLAACSGSGSSDTPEVSDVPDEVPEEITVSASTASANSQRFSIAQDTTLTVRLEGEDGSAFNFAITTDPANGVLTGKLSGINPVLVYTPADGFTGDDSFEFEVTDNDGNKASGTVSIRVVSVVQASLDSDGDGLSDLDEINRYGTSPLLADTDADGFDDFREVVTFGFDAGVNNLRFNPLIADIPQIDVQLTSAPDIFMNYTTTSGTSTTISTNRSQSSSQSVSSSKTLGQSTSFEQSYTAGIEISAETEVDASLFNVGASQKVGVTLSYSNTFTFGQESSQSWTEEQSRENSTAVDKGRAFEESNTIATSGGGVAVTVRIRNGGNISYRLTNLFLSATYIDLSRPDPIVPVGNLAFENARGFQPFTLAPDEFSGQLNFSTAELSIDTTRTLLANAQGLIISPATFDMLDENGVSYTFNNTAMRAQDAMVIVDFAGLNAQETLRLMVATNANPERAGITIADVLQKVLQLEISTDATDGFLTDVGGVSNNEPAGRWVILHGARSGNDDIVTTIYTTPSDKSRVQSINSNVGNIVSSYDLGQVLVRGGDILHLVYLVDDDQDGISNRSELVYGTRIDNADTDGDQLSDSAEVNGWEVSYLERSGAVVRRTVTSNPLLGDTDGDGLSDFVEANTSQADSRLKRDPQSRDTDGDGLADDIDDLDTAGNFTAGVYDQLDIRNLTATLASTSTFPSDVTVTYEVLDVTEKGASPGNGINSYEVHIYRHRSGNGTHPDPLQPPIDYAPAVTGQTLTCGSNCNWELVNISPSIPGASIQSFTETLANGVDNRIQSGEDYKYIAYTRINGLYKRSLQTVFASAAVETVTIHVLPGNGSSRTTLTNVRTLADFRTLVSDPNKRIEYSAQYNEIFVSEGLTVVPIRTVNGYKFAEYGSVYDAKTLAKKSVDSYRPHFLGYTTRVRNPTRYYYRDCPIAAGNNLPANCWIESNADNGVLTNAPNMSNGYVTDAVNANDVGNALSHPLGQGDGAFTLDWMIKFDNSVITPRPQLVSNQLRYICGTYHDRIRTPDDFSLDQAFDLVPAVTTEYVLRPNPLDTSCDSIDVFADTYTDAGGTPVYRIDPVTGGATFSRTLPAQPGCYRIRFIAYEYNENNSLNDGYYNKVAYPAGGEPDYANVDEAMLCRDDNMPGIWSIEAIPLDQRHEAATVSVPATTPGNPNFIDYTTRPLVWDDTVARTTEEGRLKVNYLIEVTVP